MVKNVASPLLSLSQELSPGRGLSLGPEPSQIIFFNSTVQDIVLR